jgi:diguanylate cyclase (GGDEF)-like protein/PAS domain S-box-containing protein
MAETAPGGNPTLASTSAALFECAGALVAIVAADGRLLALSPHWTPLTGRSATSLHALVATPDDDIAAALEAARQGDSGRFTAAFHAGGPHHDFGVAASGDELLVAATPTAAASDGAGPATPPDATEARLRAIQQALPGAEFEVHQDIDGALTLHSMSEGLRDLCGLDADCPLDDIATLLGLMPEQAQTRFLEATRQARERLTLVYRELALHAPAGVVHVELRAVPTMQPDGTLLCHGLLVDVTEQRAARAEADRVNAILQSTPDCVAITAPDGAICYLNAGGRDLLRLGDSNVIGRSLLAFLAPADGSDGVDRASRAAARHGSWVGEATVVTAAGTHRPVAQTILCHRDANGRVERFSTFMRDLSERVAMEAELRASEARFRTLYQRTPIMLHSIDRQGLLVDVSAYWLEHLGYSREEVLGRPSTDFLTAASQRYAREVILPAFYRTGHCADVPYQVVCRDASVRDVLLTANAEYADDGALKRSLAVMVDVTDQRRAEADYREIFEHATEGIYHSTPDGKMLRANPALVALHGFSEEQELLDAVSDIANDWYIDARDREHLRALLERDGRVENFEAQIYRCATGEHLWTSENARAVRGADGTTRYYEGTVRDITAQHQAAALAAHRGEILQMIARQRPLTGVLYEIIGLLEEQNARLTAGVFRLQGGRLYTAAAPGVSNHCIQAVDGQPPAAIGSAFATALEADRAHTDTDFDTRATAADADAFAAGVRASGYGAVLAVPVRDQHGAVLGLLGAFAQFAREVGPAWTALLEEMGQITSIAMEQHRLTQQLLHQAQYDPLTDLPNRTLLSDRLGQGILDAERANQRVAVLLLDLDEFKLVNDTLGHSAGDDLLCKVATCLRKSLRSGDTVARLGGDEFVIAVALRGNTDPTEVADRIHNNLQDPIRVAEREVTARPSIGISLYPQDGQTTEALLQAADTAMYAAKHAGKNRYQYFAADMNTQVSERLRVEAELREALANHQLELFYQPQIALADHSLVGGEALLRWNHPTRGLCGPGEFLPVAERGPLIGEIDRFVLADAARAVAAWQPQRHATLISANVSARELHAEGFGAEVADTLARAGANPAGLELEITESMLMRDIEHATRQLLDLRARAPGLRVAVDDFGSGYSSLNYLRQLPIDTLKVDRSFVADIECPDRADTARAIVRTIVELGRSLGLRVVAEGVESAAQAELMRELGCPVAQGFWFNRPMAQARFGDCLG